MPFGLFNFKVREHIDLAVFTLDVPSGAVEGSSKFKHLSEVDGENGEAVVFEYVSHGLFFGFDDDLVLADD